MLPQVPAQPPLHVMKQACLQCRAARTRCDRAGPPCSRCKRIGQNCTPQTRGPGRPKIERKPYLGGGDLKPQQKQACERCRAARVKCDRLGPPCGRCHRLGVECVPQHRGPGRPRGPKPPKTAAKKPGGKQGPRCCPPNGTSCEATNGAVANGAVANGAVANGASSYTSGVGGPPRSSDGGGGVNLRKRSRTSAAAAALVAAAASSRSSSSFCQHMK